MKTLAGFDFIRLFGEVKAEEGKPRTKAEILVCYAMRATSFQAG